MTREEFEILLEQCETDIYSLCIRLCGGKEEAEELFQETWLNALEHMEEIDSHSNPKSYLIGRVIFLWKSTKRKFARREKMVPTADMPEEMDKVIRDSRNDTPEEFVLRAEEIRCLKAEVAQLKDRYRVVVEMYYSLNMPAREIAQTLHIPQGTVESRLYKARKLLQKRMEGHGYGNKEE